MEEGIIVVRIDEGHELVSPEFKALGTIFKTVKFDEYGRAFYNKFTCISPHQFRKATAIEEFYFNNGVRNINEIRLSFQIYF